MWQGSRILVFLGALLVGVGVAHAQERVVLLETNLPDAVVYADSVRLGRASLGTFRVPADARALRLAPGGGDLWAVAPLTAPLAANPDDTLALRMPFPHYYKIESIPFGASVYLEKLDGRQELGVTPVLYQSPQVPAGSFVVERPGYLAERLKPGEAVWNPYLLTLQPLTPPEAQTAEMAWRPPPKRRRWIDYTAAAVAVGAGALAVHYKFKADRLDDRYRETGDPSFRQQIKSFDTRSVVALGVMQAGVGVLALRFVLR